MADLPSLSIAYGALVADADRYDSRSDDEVRFRSAWGLCRDASRISQVCEEVLHPWSVARAPHRMIDEAMIEWDLIRVLVHELAQADPRDVLFNALVAVLAEAVARRREADLGADGLVAAALARGVDRNLLDKAIADRLSDLTTGDGSGAWVLLQPYALETLREDPMPIAARNSLGKPVSIGPVWQPFDADNRTARAGSAR